MFIAMLLKAWLISTPNQKEKHPEDSADAFTQPANSKSAGLQQKVTYTLQYFSNAWLSESHLAILQEQPNNKVPFTEVTYSYPATINLYEKHICTGLSELSAFSADKR